MSESSEHRTPEPLLGYLMTFHPLRRGKVRATLNVMVSNRAKQSRRKHVWIEELVAEGWKVETHSVVDTRERKRLEEYVERARRTVPFGNDKHPDTIRFNEAKAALAEGPKVDQRRIVGPTGGFYAEPDVSKTAIDYAEHLIAKATP